MRLIDADALVSALNNGRFKEQTGRAVPFNAVPFNAGVAFALTMVEYAPTIDAVPVVNCINCTQMEIQGETTNCHTKSCCFCKKWKSPVSPVGFCNFGERKDDE